MINKEALDNDYEEFCAALGDILDKRQFKELPRNPLKSRGSDHYKTGDVEPIDLYRSGDMLRDFALANIIKYAFRNRRAARKEVSASDMEKILHYVAILLEGGG